MFVVSAGISNPDQDYPLYISKSLEKLSYLRDLDNANIYLASIPQIIGPMKSWRDIVTFLLIFDRLMDP